MSDIPRPRPHRPNEPTGLSLGKKAGLDPLHMEPPTSTTGLKPLGQVEGLEEIQPTTMIFPLAEPVRDQGVPTRMQARRLALALDWDPHGGQTQS